MSVVFLRESRNLFPYDTSLAYPFIHLYFQTSVISRRAVRQTGKRYCLSRQLFPFCFSVMEWSVSLLLYVLSFFVLWTFGFLFVMALKVNS